jgi:tetratricopeptide (TPR) repeat protein
MLSNKYQKVANALKKFKPIDDIEKCEVTTLYATNFWLQGKTEQALQRLLSFPVLKINKEFLSDEDEFKNEATIDNLYSIARMYVLLKQYPKAISFLTKALDAGFKYDRVLYNDTVWNFITAKNWDKLIAKYQLGIDYATYKEQIINPIGYRIPDQGEGYKQ